MLKKISALALAACIMLVPLSSEALAKGHGGNKGGGGGHGVRQEQRIGRGDNHKAGSAHKAKIKAERRDAHKADHKEARKDAGRKGAPGNEHKGGPVAHAPAPAPHAPAPAPAPAPEPEHGHHHRDVLGDIADAVVAIDDIISVFS